MRQFCAPFLFSFTLATVALGHTPPPRRLCSLLLAEVVAVYQEGSTGLRVNPFTDIVARLPQDLRPQAVDRQHPESLAAFEDDVIALFETAPALRDHSALQHKWGFTAEQLQDVLVFYATRIWDNRFDLVGSTPQILTRLRELARAQLLLEPSDPDSAAARYFYYRGAVAKKSVPEIAAELYARFARPFAEGEVYEELSDLQVSIVEAFTFPMDAGAVARATATLPGHTLVIVAGRNFLDVAADLIGRGAAVPAVAAALGFGTEALRYVLHHVGVLPRYVTWQRVVETPGGRRLSETEYLIELRNAGLASAEIAEHLNQITGTVHPDSPDRRTEESVKAKIAALGLTPRRVRAFPDRFHATYGYLKRHGQLIVETTIRFLIDHHRCTDAWLAGELGVAENSLRDFYERHSLVRVGGSLQPAIAVETRAQQLLDRYARQVREVDAVVAFVRRTGKYPRQKDFGAAPELAGMNDGRFHGTGGYGPGSDYAPTATFSSRVDAVLAVHHRAHEQGVPFSVRGIEWHSAVPSRIRSLEALEAIDEYLDFSTKHGRFPTLRDFRAKRVRTAPARLYGVNEYKTSGYHAGYDDALGAMFTRANTRGIRPPWQTIIFVSPETMPSWLLERTREQLADDYLRVSAELGRHLKKTDFGEGEQQVRVEPRRYFGNDNYGPGEPQRDNAIHPSRMDAYLYIYRRALARGLPFSFLEADVTNTPLTDEFIALRRREALDRYLDWMVLNGRHPVQTDFRLGPENLRMSYTTFYTVYFPSRAEARAALAVRARERNIVMPEFSERY